MYVRSDVGESPGRRADLDKDGQESTCKTKGRKEVYKGKGKQAYQGACKMRSRC